MREELRDGGIVGPRLRLGEPVHRRRELGEELGLLQRLLVVANHLTGPNLQIRFRQNINLKYTRHVIHGNRKTSILMFVSCSLFGK